MEKEVSEGQTMRVLSIYSRLCNGEAINKQREALNFGVSVRTIQRDLAAIQCFVEQESSNGEIQEIVLDREKNVYRLQRMKSRKLDAKEILAVGEVLLESRALVKTELFPVINKLLEQCADHADKKLVKEMLGNELEHYVELQHKKPLLNILWDMGLAIKNHQYVEIKYQKLGNQELVVRKLKPVAILFSEYYFYLTGYFGDNDKEHPGFPTIYRVDRIQKYEVLEEHFAIVYKDRFEEGQFRKRIPFMYGGPLTKVNFVYRGLDINAVLDRLPSATCRQLEDGSYLVTAEVFGETGIEMWLRSQGEKVNTNGSDETIKSNVR